MIYFIFYIAIGFILVALHNSGLEKRSWRRFDPAQAVVFSLIWPLAIIMSIFK